MNIMPENINKVTPTPSSDAVSVTKLIKHSGAVVGYELSNGTRVSKEEGVTLAKSGGISGVAVGVSGKGEEYLRTLPDGAEGNNLSSLPSVTE